MGEFRTEKYFESVGTVNFHSPKVSDKQITDPEELYCEPKSLPPAYLSRTEKLIAIGSVMSENAPRVRIILGRSGVGKSALAYEFFLTAKNGFSEKETRWMDCRVKFEWSEEELQHLCQCKLIIFDNVTNSHPFVEKELLKYFPNSINIITTSSEKVAKSLRSTTGTLDYESVIIELDVFSADDIQKFCNKTIPQEYRSFVIKKGSDLGGLPIVLQLLRELCLDYNCIEDLESQCLNFKDIFNQWLLAKDENGTLTTIVEILSLIPFVGMDRKALIEVSELNETDVDKAIRQIQNLGIVTEICVPIGEQLGNILVVYDKIRELYVENNHDFLSQWRQRYLSLLKIRLSSSKTISDDIVTCVDAWLVGWKDLFDLSSNQVENLRYQNHHALLETLIESDSGAWIIALNSIPHFLSNIIQDPSRESCAIMIGISHMVLKLKGNKALANTMWLGCRNPDAWARASSIRATISQWEKLGSKYKEKGEKELNHWLTYAYQNFCSDRENKLETHWSNSLGFDYLAVICGLFWLGDINKALNVMRHSQFEERFPTTTLANLAIFVILCEQRVINSNVGDERSTAFINLVNQWMKTLQNSPIRLQQTAFRIGRYVSKQFGLEINSFQELSDCNKTATFACDIANMTKSDGLFDFVLQMEDEPKWYI